MKKLLHGKDSFLSLKEAKFLATQLSQNGSIELISIDATEISPESIIQYLSSDNMFSSSRVLFFKRLYNNKKKEELVEYLIKNFENFSDANHYIFWEDQKIASNTKYFKLFKNALEEFNEMNKPSFYSWAKKVLDENEIESDRTTIQILSNRVNFSSERFANEVEKYKIEGLNKITEDLVVKKTTDTLEKEIWDLTKYLNSGNKEQIFDTLTRLTNQLVDPIFIISMIARNLRLVTQVKELTDQGVSSREICSKLRIPPFTLPELQQNANRTDWEKIKFFYEKLASLDCEIKRGNLEANTGLILLLTRV